MSVYQARLIRAGLVWLVVTGALGVLFFVRPELAVAFRTTHVHLGVLGFFLSMVVGVAYWMMPRPGGLRQPRLEAVTFWLLNLGLLTRSIADPWRWYGGPGWLGEVLIGAGLMHFGAIVTFALAMSQRVKTAEQIQRLRGMRAQR